MGYEPNKRVKRFKQGYKISKNRVAWARLGIGSIAMMRYADEDEQEVIEDEDGVQSEASTEPGPTIRLVIRKSASRRPTTLDLTMLTQPELQAMRKVFNMAFDAAEPVCQLRDEEVARKHAQGDDSNTRLYRPVPQFIEREGSGVEHIESLRRRLTSDASRDGLGSDNRIRDDGTEVADQESQPDQP